MVRTRDVGLALDSFFPDEAGLTYRSGPRAGTHLNKYTRAFVAGGPAAVEISQSEALGRGLDPARSADFDELRPGTLDLRLPNPLDPAVSSRLMFPESGIPAPARGRMAVYSVFAPPKLRIEMAQIRAKGAQCPRSVRVTLLFGTGSELGRHGLRTFVDRGVWRMIINVPGVEPQYAFAQGHRWGVGMSTAQVREAVQKVFGAEVDFVVDRLIGFSTGYIGVTGTIRNELVDLRNVELLAFLDCNYGEGRVKAAIRSLRLATSGRVRVVAYAASAAGTPLASQHMVDLDIDTGGLVWLFGDRGFQALTHARLLHAGLEDKTLDPSDIDPAILERLTNFLAALPARGTVVSDPRVHQLVGGRKPPAGSQTVAAWYQANKVEVEFFLGVLWKKSGGFPELIRLIWKHRLPGWSNVDDSVIDSVTVATLAEGAHDFVPFEFGWEILS